MRSLFAIFILTLLPGLLIGCGNTTKPKTDKNKDTLAPTIITTHKKIISKDTLVTIGKTSIWIKSPEGEPKADILVLPGWNFPKEKICKESDFCEKALAKGYRLILPEMMKSVYASKYYPETREDYQSFLTLTWVIDTMIPALQKDYGMLKVGSRNYLHGISTGARGAALVHLNTGTLFSKVVLLSGDYNNASMPEDNLLKNTFGPYTEFKERWIANDNPWEQTSSWTADLYIAHGNMDDVVDFKQSLTFSGKIHTEHPEVRMTKNYPDAKHDFEFWGGETENVLNFFEK